MLGNNFASLALWFNLYYFWVGAGFIYLAPRRSALSARGCPHGTTFAAHYSQRTEPAPQHKFPAIWPARGCTRNARHKLKSTSTICSTQQKNI